VGLPYNEQGSKGRTFLAYLRNPYDPYGSLVFDFLSGSSMDANTELLLAAVDSRVLLVDHLFDEIRTFHRRVIELEEFERKSQFLERKLVLLHKRNEKLEQIVSDTEAKAESLRKKNAIASTTTRRITRTPSRTETHHRQVRQPSSRAASFIV
jgi:hypothetical protein